MSDIVPENVNDELQKEDERDFRRRALTPETSARVDRLRVAIREAGGNVAVAKRSGVPLSTIGTYLAGREMRVPALLAIADATDVTLDWLVSGREPMQAGDGTMISSHSIGGETRPTTQADLDAGRDYGHPSSAATSIAQLNRFVSIPRYNIQASAGGGALVQNEQVVDYLAFDEDFIRRVIQRKVEHLVLIEARGDSMDPTIRDSDLLLVDMSSGDRVENNGIYVLGLDDAILVKRIQRRLDGSMVVLSDNPRYAPETVSAADFKQLRIIGQVIWQAGPVRS